MEFAEFIKTPQVDNVILRRPFQRPVEGTLCVMGHHLILSSRQNNKEELVLLHSSIDSVEKKLVGSGGTLTLHCKDFNMLQLEIPSADDCLNIGSSIEQLSNIDDITLKYPFFFRANFEVMEDGWQAFQPENEISRFKDCADEWRLSYINKDYKVCPSYPHAVVVPKTIDDETLLRVAQFRQHGRFPVLSYYHRDSKTVLLRSSQPLTGTNGRRCKEDERLVNSVLGIGRRGYIVDTRTYTTAKGAQSKGGGYELEAHYPQWKRIHQSVERRQVLQESLIKLIEACADTSATTDKWLSKLESSNWLSHVKDILTCACLVAQCIDKDAASVLIHGSDGYDTTLQVTSLVQVILDHDCRTFTGDYVKFFAISSVYRTVLYRKAVLRDRPIFQQKAVSRQMVYHDSFEALIEREWLQAGHPFGMRCAKSAYAFTKNRQESPVFLLFLDCVWQIWQQFPCSFEFNDEFLITLCEHAYSSQFGTFLCNNEMERKGLKLSSKTVSLWSYLNRPEVLEKYLNPLYDPNPAVIWPSVAPQSLELWSSIYQRSFLDKSKKREKWIEIAKICEYDKELRSKVSKLRRQLASLEREALSAGVIIPVGLDTDMNE